MIYFIHPDLKKREEPFGGVVQTDRGIFILNQNEFTFIKDFQTGPNKKNKLLKRFLKINAICSINEKEIESVN